LPGFGRLRLKAEKGKIHVLVGQHTAALPKIGKWNYMAIASGFRNFLLFSRITHKKGQWLTSSRKTRKGDEKGSGGFKRFSVTGIKEPT
jgi:hypothetical protein